MNDTLLRLVYDRLDRDAAVDEPWAELVMAACEGEAAVEAGARRTARRRASPRACSDSK